MDEVTFQEQVAAVEAAYRHSPVKHSAMVHELDRLAEHLVGQTAPEAQTMKHRVQDLITEVAPERHEVQVYTDAYCHSGAR